MIKPVILAGGSGTRLWPLSRETCPKQYLSLLNNDLSLIQKTVLRLRSFDGLELPLIICNQTHYALCRDQMHAIGMERAQYILEPVGRNTGPAVAAAARYCQDFLNVDSKLLILPSDHWIHDEHAFAQAIENAISLVNEQKIVTFGITPTEPCSGYGYIQAGDADKTNKGFEIRSFTEKPTREQAQILIDKGNYYWNSGIFFAKASVFSEEVTRHAPEIAQNISETFSNSKFQDNLFYLNEKTFSKCPDISFDYAVMEKTEVGYVYPLSIAWNDLGSWDAVAQASPSDENGNNFQGTVIAKDTQNCLIRSDDKWIVTYGVSDLVIISSHESVLIMNKNNTEYVRSIVKEAKEIEKKSPALHAEIIRPWGVYESVLKGKSFHVKQLTINPGAKISLQMHHHRSETWVIVQGIAKVTLDKKESELNVNESIHIPKTALHRVENIGNEPLIIVETQIGDYLGEDDIMRIQDDYGRV